MQHYREAIGAAEIEDWEWAEDHFGSFLGTEYKKDILLQVKKFDELIPESLKSSVVVNQVLLSTGNTVLLDWLHATYPQFFTRRGLKGFLDSLNEIVSDFNEGDTISREKSSCDWLLNKGLLTTADIPKLFLD